MTTHKKMTVKHPQKLSSSIDAQVSRVLRKLIEQEPRLKVTLSRAIDYSNGPTDIADQTVQIYRQKLRDKEAYLWFANSWLSEAENYS